MEEEFEEEIFSDDPEKQLRIENDILKLKIQAELGGDFEGNEDIPANVENIFLKNVLEFEHKQSIAPVKTLLEILDYPVFVNHVNLLDEEIEFTLTEVETLMEEKGIVVDYATDYPSREKYQFITEELFVKEIAVIDIPGLTMHYIYEEYHPNHALDIEKLTEHFFRHWIDRSFESNTEVLSAELILEDGVMLSSERVIENMNFMFQSFDRFDNAAYSIDTVFFEMHEEGTGLGYVEGQVEYDAILETGEEQQYKGFFKLDVQYDSRWSVFFFHWPGFNW